MGSCARQSGDHGERRMESAAKSFSFGHIDWLQEERKSNAETQRARSSEEKGRKEKKAGGVRW